MRRVRGDAHGAVDQMADLTGNAGHGDEIAGDVLEQRLQIDFLLIMRAKSGSRLLADDGDHRHVIHLRVIQAVQQMDRARPRRRVAKPDLAGELGVRGRHEGGHLLMPHLDVLHFVLGPFQRHVEAADAIAGIAVDALQAPLVQPVPDELADVHRHRKLSRERLLVQRRWPRGRCEVNAGWREIHGMATLGFSAR